MDQAKKRRNLIIAGVILMSGLLLFPCLVGAIVYQLPRYYFSKSTVDIGNTQELPLLPGVPPTHNADPPVSLQTVQKIMAPYGSEADYHQVRQTSLFELGIWDQNPAEAARKANAAAQALHEYSPSHVKIWETAEPALTPGKPKALFYAFCGVIAGLLAFAAGAIVLLIALLNAIADRRESPLPSA